MICNISRVKGLNECRQKEYNREVKRLMPTRDAEPLMTGEAYHAGTAHLFATGNVEDTVRLTEETYRKRLEGQTILQAEMPLIEREILIAKTAVRKYAIHYPKEDFQVIMPEIAFCIPLPNTLHHCHYFHKLAHPDIPFEDCPNHYVPILPDTKPNGCLQPHYFKGRVDALLSWKGMIWIFEQKTSGLQTDNWWRQWLLDIQLSGYTYGVEKATGIRPQGVLLNKIRKPKKNEDIHKWEQSNIFEREPFLRSNADLKRFETQFIKQCNAYEDAMFNDNIWMNTAACMNWNRTCYFHESCTSHGDSGLSAFKTRPDDYVEDEYYTILGIPNPSKPVESKEPVNGTDAV